MCFSLYLSVQSQDLCYKWGPFQYSKHNAFSERLGGICYVNGFAL